MNFDDIKKVMESEGFVLNEDEYRNYEKDIDKYIPDFDDDFLIEDNYQQDYKKLLTKYDLDMMVFILQNEKEPKSIVLTPILNQHTRCN